MGRSEKELKTIIGSFYSNFFVPTIDNRDELCIRVFYFFSFFSHAKLGSTDNHRTGLRDVSFYSLFSPDLNQLKKFQKSFPSVFDFSSYFERIKEASSLILID